MWVYEWNNKSGADREPSLTEIVGKRLIEKKNFIPDDNDGDESISTS